MITFRRKFNNAYNSMPYQADITKAYNAKLLASHNAKNIERLSRQVRRNTPELKCVHNHIDNTAIVSGAAAVKEITLIGQGNDVYQREGNHISLVGLNVRGYKTGDNIDVYIVLSRNGVVPSYGDFLNFPKGYLYTNQREEFRVLAYLHNYGGGSAPGFEKHLKLRNIPVYYNGTATGNGVRNRLYVLIKNDTGAVGGGAVFCELYFRDR